MPNVKAEALEEVTRRIFHAAGMPEEDARITARFIVESNVTGHDSHGVVAVPGYVRNMGKGYIVAGAPTEVVKEGPAYAIVDGHRNLGHVVAYRATKMAIEKARDTTISCVAVRNVGHMGRMGAYPEMAAREGMFGMICTGSGGVVHSVAPYGGTKGRTGTNPIAMAFPSDLDGPILLDMATSVHATGKIRVYQRQGVPLPPDWLIDREGRPTTNPEDFYAGGAHRTFGGLAGYKGYGLSFFVEILSGIVTRDGHARDTGGADYAPGFSNGSIIVVINTESFVPLETLKKEIGDLTQWMKSSPPAQGFDGVLYPGEPEARTRRERLANGIPLDDTTWEEIRKLAQEYGLKGSLPPLS